MSVGTYNPISVTDIVDGLISAGIMPPSTTDIINAFIAVNMAPTAADILVALNNANMAPTAANILAAFVAAGRAPTAAEILAVFVAGGMTPPSPATILAAFVAAGMTPPSAASIITALQTTTDPGLLSTSDSLGYRVAEIERHFHSNERWLGKLPVQTPTQWGKRLPCFTPYRAISGASTWGADANDEAQVLGTADTPVIAGNTRYDIHRIFVSDASDSGVYNIRLVYGTGTMADAIIAEQFSTMMMRMDAATGQIAHGPVTAQMRCGTGGATKVWVQVASASNNAWIDFFVGLHEYEG